MSKKLPLFLASRLVMLATAAPSFRVAAPSFLQVVGKRAHAVVDGTVDGLKLSVVDSDQSVKDQECERRYRSAMTTLIKEDADGVDIVLGANDGQRFDPAAEMFDFWSKVPNHTKIFVEPVPPLFARLSQNTKDFKNVVLMNKAVRVAEQGTHLDLFCWDMDTVEEAVTTGKSTLPNEVRIPKDYWTALCSTDKNSVLVRANVFDTDPFKALTPDKKAEVQAEVEKHIVKYSIEALTPEQIIQQNNLHDVQYLQIDVEGMDHLIVKALPFARDGFLPKVIMYENGNEDLSSVLESHGYDSCCCVTHSGSNVAAFLK